MVTYVQNEQNKNAHLNPNIVRFRFSNYFNLFICFEYFSST